MGSICDTNCYKTDDMFRIIGIETIDPGDTLLNFLNAMPGIENNSRLWMEKFKKDRYDVKKRRSMENIRFSS